MTETKEIQKEEGPTEKTKAIQVVQGSLQLQTLDDIWRLANMFCQSGLVPNNLDTPQKVVVVLEAGAEHGFKPWQSLQCFHIVNGRLGMDGSAMLAKIRSSKVCEYIKCSFNGTPYEDNYKAIAISKRRDEPVEYRTEFSMADAKKANLLTKDNWKYYPKDMLAWRAVSRHARRYYSDEVHARYTPDELSEFSPMPLDQTFEQAQLAAEQKIADEAGSEPTDTEFESNGSSNGNPAFMQDDEPVAGAEEAASRKAKAEKEKKKLAAANKKGKAAKKTKAGAKDKDDLPKYHCDKCHKDFDVPILKDGGDLQCPKCLSLNVNMNNKRQDIDPDITEENN